MTDRLLPHQETGARFLADRGFAILADDAGLGKTATTVRGADLAGARRILVSCPAAVRMHWAREFERWQFVKRDIEVIEGRLKRAPTGAQVTVVSHDPFARPESIALLAAAGPYDLIVTDELHFFRSPDAARSRALLEPKGLWTVAHRFWGLTGTPIVNSAADLYGLFYGPMRVDVDWITFCRRFAEMRPSYAGMVPRGVKDEAGLADMLRPHLLRRTLDSIGLKLPRLDIEHRAVALPSQAMQRIMADLDGWTEPRLLRALEDNDELRDAQMARVRRTLGLAKVAPVAAHVHDIVTRGSGPVVVFFEHTDVRKALFDILHGQLGLAVSWIDGKITRPQLGAAEQWFQAGRLHVLLVQTQAGGVGLTLTRADRVVVAELPWTSVALWQAVKRVHRITQTRPVMAEVLRADECWLETVLANVVSKKHKASEALLSLLTTCS